MDRIREIDHKILKLRAQKEQAETRMAKILLKKIQTILGQDFDVNLVTLLLDQVWSQAEAENREVWRQQAKTFRNGASAKTIPENRKTIEATHDAKTNP